MTRDCRTLLAGHTPGTERTLFKLCVEGEWGWK